MSRPQPRLAPHLEPLRPNRQPRAHPHACTASLGAITEAAISLISDAEQALPQPVHLVSRLARLEGKPRWNSGLLGYVSPGH
jgi:hypothetical protein